MRIKVIYFAIYSELLAKREEFVMLEEGATVKLAFDKCTSILKDRDQLLKATLFAINEQYVEPSAVLRDGDELVFIPPVSGG